MPAKTLSLLVLLFSATVAYFLEWRGPVELPVGGGIFLAGGTGVLLLGATLAASLAVWARLGRPERWLLAAVLVVATFFATRPLRWAEAPPAGVTDASISEAASERRTLLVAIDALSWNRLWPMVRRGELPSFQRLMDEGAYGVLRSYETRRPDTGEVGYWSPVVWTTIATGVSAEVHGIDGFGVRQQGGKTRMASTRHRKAPALWNLFGAFGRQVGVVGWWATWPAEPVDGIMATSNLGLRGHRPLEQFAIEDDSWFDHQRRLTWPLEFVDEIRSEVGLPNDADRLIGEELFPLDRYPVLGPEQIKTFRSIVWQDRFYQRIAKYLLESKDFALYAVYFEGIDLAGHHFWPFEADPKLLEALYDGELPEGFDDHLEVVERYYRLIDRYLGELVEAAGDETTILVCSDHGFESKQDKRLADHSGDGAFLLKGPGIRSGADLSFSLTGSLGERIDSPASVFDILPTLLYLHGLPIAETLEGRVLYRALSSRYVRDNPEIRVAGYGNFAETYTVGIEVDDTDANEAEYRRRMKALGYIN